MATQKFTYTGASQKWKKTGKQYVLNKSNRKWLTQHFQQSYNTGSKPQYRLPNHLRYNPYTNQIQSINRNKKLMSKANSNAIFMHCLPVGRGEEVTDDVIDGKQSVVWRQALNRVHAQKSIIKWCLD